MAQEDRLWSKTELSPLVFSERSVLQLLPLLVVMVTTAR